MNEIAIPFGDGNLLLSVEDSQLAGILTPCEEGTPKDQSATVRAALENPIGSPRLSELASDKARVLVITSDHTRAVPSKITMPLILEEIRRGNPNAEIRILLATGMHRATTVEEIISKFGPEIAGREMIISHDSRAECVFYGTLPSGGRLMLNPLVDWADLIVSEGFIEPHFFAGFSGGRKSILPGIASEETVRYNHNASFIHDDHARQGVLKENPIHRDMLFAAKAARLRFILNVLIDGEKRVVHAMAGDPEQAHEAGCAKCLERTRVQGCIADIVVTGNGGYPMDQNIYQSVKGMTAAEACVRRGGVIILCAEARDGHGGENFVKTIAKDATPEELLREIERVPSTETPPDQWQAQILLRVMCHAHVIFVTRKENRECVERMHMRFAPDAQTALEMARKLVGEDARVAVIPDGVGVIVC